MGRTRTFEAVEPRVLDVRITTGEATVEMIVGGLDQDGYVIIEGLLDVDAVRQARDEFSAHPG